MSLLDPEDYMVKPGQAQALVAPPQQAAPPQDSSLLDGLFAPKPPHKADNLDRINMLGAVLRDIGSSLHPEHGYDKGPSAVAQTQAAIDAEGQPAPALGAVKGKAGAKAGARAAPTDTAVLYQVAKSLFPGDPKAQYLFATGNSDFLGKISDPYGFHAVTGGDTVYGAPGTSGPTVAPKLVDHDGQYGTQGADGYQATGTAAPSYADKTGWENAITAAQKAVEDARHNGVEEGQGRQRLGIEGGQLNVARQHLGLDQGALGLNRQKFGHELNPGAPVIGSPADYAKLPHQTQYVDPEGHLRFKP